LRQESDFAVMKGRQAHYCENRLSIKMITNSPEISFNVASRQASSRRRRQMVIITIFVSSLLLSQTPPPSPHAGNKWKLGG